MNIRRSGSHFFATRQQSSSLAILLMTYHLSHHIIFVTQPYHQYIASHISKANSNCSNRLKAAYNYASCPPTKLSRSARTNQRRRNACRNKLFQESFIFCDKAPQNLKKNFVPFTFFDGSIEGSQPTTKRPITSKTKIGIAFPSLQGVCLFHVFPTKIRV